LDHYVRVARERNGPSHSDAAGRDGTVAASHEHEVSDVDAVHAEADRRNEGIVYPLTDEPWESAAFSYEIRTVS
jgi:hypothetical protein